MTNLQAFPAEILALIVEQLVITIGIQKAVLLRTVNHAFDAAILQAICVSQVVDIHDPATPYLASQMVSSLRGKIIEVKSRSADIAARKGYISIVAMVNRTLDTLINETNQVDVRRRHESNAGAVLLKDDSLVDAQVEAQNLLSGAAVTGNLSVLRSLLERNQPAADVNGVTPYFYSPLTLAAAGGHLSAVHYLLERGARLDSAASGWREYANLAELADWNSQDEYIQFGSLRHQPPSALRTAVLNGHGDIVHLLLQPQYRLPTTSVEYLRAIVAGACAGRLDLIEVLF